MYELMPIYDNANSFYNKALVRQEKDFLVLTSYTTDVLAIDTKTNTPYRLSNGQNTESRTTIRHIYEMCKQQNIPMTLKKWREMPVENLIK